MANPYTKQSATNYNASPPPDDGSQTSSNLITWDGIKSKLADPIKALADAINTAVFNAFAVVARTDEANTFSGDNTFSGSNTFSASNTFTANQIIRSSDSGATVAPVLTLDRNSASPAASDVVGELLWNGRDSGGNSTSYAAIAGQINDPTDASEDAELQFYTQAAGTLGSRMRIVQGVVVGSPTGSDKGAGTVNATAIYDDGVQLNPLGIAKGLVLFANGSGALAALNATVTVNGTGDYTVSWTTPFASANYAYSISAEATSGEFVGVAQVVNGGKTASSLRVSFRTASGTAFDPASVSVIAFGTQ